MVRIGHIVKEKGLITLALFLTLYSFPASAKELSNEYICEMAEDAGRLNEITYAQCNCAMGKADEHLDDDMKLALVEAMLAGTSPIHAMLARGYKMNVIANTLEAYGEATFADCGPALSF